jgi:hypothetical protein
MSWWSSMVTLKDALDHKDIILEFANDFGFENVRVYCDPASTILQLVVTRKMGAKDHRVALEAYLIERLNLQIVIVQENKLKPIYKTSTLKQSAPIDDIEAIEKLYQKRASEVTIDQAPNDIESKNERVPILDLANEILVGQRKPGFTPSKVTFFSEAPEEKKSPFTINSRQLKRRVDELTEEVDTNFVMVLKSLPQEVLDKMDKHIQEIKKSRIVDIQSQTARKQPIKGN